MISELAAALDKSPLAETLFTLTGLMSGNLNNFRRHGQPNTSGTAASAWEILNKVPPFEVTVRVEAPGRYGISHIQSLNITVQVVSRLTAWRDSRPIQRHQPGSGRRLEPAEWAALLNAMTATLTEPRIIVAIADLADVDTILVPRPRTVHLISDHENVGFLPAQLRPITGAGGSRGAYLQADPALDLADPADRARQATRWICQIAQDAGLTGMESLAAQLPPSASQ